MRKSAVPLREVHVWELPVRLYHWINALCIVTLCITGYLIGRPACLYERHRSFFQLLVRNRAFIHFVTAFLFFFNFIFRLYWGFAGNEFSRWYNFIPLKRCQWKEMYEVIKVDVLQVTNKKIDSIGHNSLASFIYFITFLIFLLQCLTGFGNVCRHEQILPAAISSPGWFLSLEGICMYGRSITSRCGVFIIFAIIHVYLVFYHDYIERRGVTSSMIGGWKFIEEDVIERHEENKNKCPGS